MDTTPKYILMCEKAVEVQNYFRQKVKEMNKKKYCGTLIGDPVDLRSQGYCLKHKCLLGEGVEGNIKCYKHEDCDNYEGWSQNYILLFRQDQLQEILGFETYELLDICSESDGIMWQALHDYATSMEQLWLAFVMKEKYNKLWSETKKDWVKDGGS